jgi:hypothetical protein
MNKRELMESGVSTKPKVHMWFPNEEDEDDFEVPLWIDQHGWLRIGLPKRDPQHAGDMEQIALKLSDILAGIAKEIEDKGD